MADSNEYVVPVWTLCTSSGTRIPSLADGDSITPDRLTELRSALAAFAESPIVTLEAHPLPKTLDRSSSGIRLDAMSPLAQHLSKLLSQTAKSAPAAAKVDAAGEVLYRMVVPAKVAAQVGRGLVQPMASKAAAGGIHSAMVGGSGIAAQATFVPVAAGTAAVGLTVAAPLILMAVAVGVSAYVDHQRQQAVQHITELLEKLHGDKLNAERAALNGCRDAIDKATTVLLDRGKIGASLGLDSAVYAISKATESARDRLDGWTAALDGLPEGPVDMDQITEAFPGIETAGGEFRTHLQLSALAIALKRRVIVLQAVEHSQSDAGNPFENFLRILKSDQQRVDQLEAGIASVLLRLSSLKIRTPNGLWDQLVTRGYVNELLAAAHRLRELREGVVLDSRASDVVIEIAKHANGSLFVLPAVAA
ncbi:hypothetical protein [Nakamurella deserti]|uniref:hypothetical protein n=1 Tax=Nakamurella deserti TaxID=2164074 RepID=UPI000DBE9A55|nr:hypothetical protein [Nakamurella deserti]